MKSFLSNIAIGLFAMFLVGFCCSSFASTGSVNGTEYKNERINLAFQLPSGYEYVDEKTLEEMPSKMFVGLVPVKIKYDMALKTPDKEEGKYSVQVVTMDSIFIKTNTATEALSKCQEIITEYCNALQASDITIGTDVVNFCGLDTTMCSASYVLNNKSNYVFCYLYNVEDGYVAIVTHGNTKEEAQRLIESFYFINN